MATPLESVLNSWKTRDAEAQALGIDRSAYQELAKRDVKNVMSGGSAIPVSEVNIALLSNAIQKPIIQTPERGTGPKDTIGNIPKDIEDIVRGFIPGMARWAWNLPGDIAASYLNPKGATAEGRAELGYESGGGVAGAVRNAGKDPILSLVPGVFTAGKLTTPEGRKELQQRPVTTFLDVLPFASKAGKVATAGKVAEKGSATAALQQGHVVRGAFRGATDTIAKAPVVGRVTSRERWNQFAADLGVDEAARETLSRPFSVMTRKADKEAARFMREEVMPLFEGMDEASRQALTVYGQQRRRPGSTTLSPRLLQEHQARASRPEPSTFSPDWYEPKLPPTANASDYAAAWLSPDYSLLQHDVRSALVKEGIDPGRLSDPAYAEAHIDKAIDVAKTTKPTGDQRNTPRHHQETIRAFELQKEAIQSTKYTPVINPEYDAILSRVDELNDKFYRYGEKEGGLARLYLPGVEQPVTFASESPVILANQRRMRAKESYERVKHRRENAQIVLNNWQNNLVLREGKVRGFMESPEQFAARGVGRVGPDVVREAAQPMVEAFQFLDPEKVFREYLDKFSDGTVRGQTAAFIMRDFRKLKGEAGYGPKPNTGLVARFDEALARGDIKTASATLTEINRILRHKSWDGFDTTTRIREHVRDLREELVGLRKRTTSFGYAARMARKAEDRLARYTNLERLAQEKMADRDAQFFKDLADNPPQSFNPLIVQKIREGAIEEAKLLYQGDELAMVEQKIATSPVMTEISSLIGKEKFRQLFDDIKKNWVQLAQEGHDPVWVHHVPPSRYENALKPRLLPDHESRPGQWRDVVTNFGPGVMDIAVGLGAASAEIISRRYTTQFLNDWVIPKAKDKAAVREQIIQTLTDNGTIPRHSFGIMGEVERIMKRDYRDFDPARFGMKWPSITREGLVLPVGVDRALNHFTRGFQYIPIRGIYDKTMKVYKYSVLAGPKQASDAIFGGLLTVMLREPKALFKMRDAWTMMKEGKVPEELAHNFYDLDTDKLWHLAAGKTMGRVMAEAAKFAPERLAKLEEGVTTMYRAATYLSAAERGTKKGLSAKMAEEVGLRTAYKTLVDFDGMSHLERVILRNVFPFYSFMRYTMQFILTYPSDHPLRAAILSRFADMEKRDSEGKAGELAEKWGNYFFIGDPDENGNVTAVDYRSLNPFQSVANSFTLAGFLGSINPLVTAGFEAAGVNTLTATPDLYPEMAYDPETGSTTARRGNVAMILAGNVLPPVEGVDAFLTLSDKMRRLKQKNPEAYRRALFQHLHMPFAFGNVNVPYEGAKAQMGKVRGAREELSAALMSGDWERVKRYNLVPYNGQLVDPARLETFWKAMTGSLKDRGLEEISPKALLPR